MISGHPSLFCFQNIHQKDRAAASIKASRKKATFTAVTSTSRCLKAKAWPRCGCPMAGKTYPGAMVVFLYSFYLKKTWMFLYKSLHLLWIFSDVFFHEWNMAILEFSTENGGFYGKIVYTWRVVHCYVWLPEGEYHFYVSWDSARITSKE